MRLLGTVRDSIYFEARDGRQYKLFDGYDDRPVMEVADPDEIRYVQWRAGRNDHITDPDPTTR